MKSQDRILETREDPTIKDLFDQYRLSHESRLLAPATRANTDKAERLCGNLINVKARDLTAPTIRLHVDNMLGGNAHIFLTRCRVIWEFARQRGLVKDNPFNGIPSPKSGEYRPWTNKEFEEFVKVASPTTAMAVRLAYYTGQRISDVLNMKWGDIHGGDIHIIQQKTKSPLRIPVHPKLKTALRKHAKTSKGEYIISHPDGSKYDVTVFRKRFTREKKRMSLPDDMVFHGLRKLTAVTLAEQGASTKEIMAVGGWKTTKMVEHYAKTASQRDLAASAISKLKAR